MNTPPSRGVDWSGVHAALDQYYSTQPARDRVLGDASTKRQIVLWMVAEKKAIKMVREAFYEATSDRNSEDTIMNHLWMSDAIKMSGYVRGE
jgi:hypothetical protein